MASMISVLPHVPPVSPPKFMISSLIIHIYMYAYRYYIACQVNTNTFSFTFKYIWIQADHLRLCNLYRSLPLEDEFSLS